MLYNLKKEHLEKLSNIHLMPDFTNVELIVATFRTDKDIAKEIIPSPLTATDEPLATVFVARYPETNFGCVYNEGALFLHCEYKGEKGVYCLSMPVDDDMAMISGRENFGYPKKLADKIELAKENNRVVGSVVRKKVEILRIECHLGNQTAEDFMKDLGEPVLDWDGVLSYKMLSFLFKYFQSPSGESLDYLPRLIREPILFRNIGVILMGKGEVVLASTPYDPLGEIPVRDIVSIFYGKWHNTMLPGKVVARVWNPMKFARHAYFKTDFIPTLLNNYDPKLSSRAREILKKAKRY